MTLKNIRKRIDEGVNLNLIVTDKFKSNLISIYIVRPLVRSEVTKNALLPMVLKRGTKNYNTFTDIQQKLEDLFGANLSVDYCQCKSNYLSFTLLRNIYAQICTK